MAARYYSNQYTQTVLISNLKTSCLHTYWLASHGTYILISLFLVITLADCCKQNGTVGKSSPITFAMKRIKYFSKIHCCLQPRTIYSLVCHNDRLIRSKQFPSLDSFHHQIVLVQKKKLHAIGLHWHGPQPTICSLHSIWSPYESNTFQINLSICKGKNIANPTIHMEKAEEVE